MRIDWTGPCLLVLAGLAAGCRDSSPAARAEPARRVAAAAAGPTWRGDPCRADADCGWDDPCRATRCQAIRGAPPVGCDKGLPPPGTCLCVDGMCTLNPTDPRRGASAAGCAGDADCAVDVPTATCHLKGRTLIGPIHREGPYCACDRASRRCHFAWSDPVPCKSWKECWYAKVPRLRPVPAKPLRTRKVRPCRDGELDAVCQSGFCQVLGWDC